MITPAAKREADAHPQAQLDVCERQAVAAAGSRHLMVARSAMTAAALPNTIDA